MGGFIAIVIGVFAIVIIVKILAWMKNAEKVTCQSCGNLMTYGRYKKNGKQCLRCGSDLLRRSGERASKDETAGR